MSTYSDGSASSVSRWRYRAGWVSASSRVMQYRDTCTGERRMMRTRELDTYSRRRPLLEPYWGLLLVKSSYYSFHI